MTIASFRHEETVTVDGEVLTLAMTFAALDAIEAETRRPFDTILRQLTGGRQEAPLSLQARVVWGLLRDHRADVTIDQAMTLVSGEAAPAIGAALGRMFVSAWPAVVDPVPGAPPPRPRKPRGALKTS